jgi:hypothetical protein
LFSSPVSRRFINGSWMKFDDGLSMFILAVFEEVSVEVG